MHKTGLLIPAYVYPTPSTSPSPAAWQVLFDAATRLKERLLVIVNPASGSGGGDVNYTAAIKTLRASGARVLGYVRTCWAQQNQKQLNDGVNYCGINLLERPDFCYQPEANVKNEVKAWYTLYSMVDGIFFDQVPSAEQVPYIPFNLRDYYDRLTSYVGQQSAGSTVVLNPGTKPDLSYYAIPVQPAKVSQVLIVGLEESLAGYQRELKTDPTWFSVLSCAHLNRSAALVYDVGSGLQKTQAGNVMESTLALLQKELVPWVYLTQDNPWNKFPDYFSELVNKFAGSGVYLCSIIRFVSLLHSWMLTIADMVRGLFGSKLEKVVYTATPNQKEVNLT